AVRGTGGAVCPRIVLTTTCNAAVTICTRCFPDGARSPASHPAMKAAGAEAVVPRGAEAVRTRRDRSALFHAQFCSIVFLRLSPYLDLHRAREETFLRREVR